MKYRNVHSLAELTFNVKTLRCFDVFQHDATKGWFERGDDIDEFFGVAFVDLKVEGVDIRKLLHEDGLALHDRL